jgi:hypothetical protein
MVHFHYQHRRRWRREGPKLQSPHLHIVSNRHGARTERVVQSDMFENPRCSPLQQSTATRAGSNQLSLATRGHSRSSNNRLVEEYRVSRYKPNTRWNLGSDNRRIGRGLCAKHNPTQSIRRRIHFSGVLSGIAWVIRRRNKS